MLLSEAIFLKEKIQNSIDVLQAQLFRLEGLLDVIDTMLKQTESEDNG